MPTKKQTQSGDKAGSKPPLAKPTTKHLAVLPSQQAPLAAVIQRARFEPRSLTPAQVLQLQRTLGNQAVGSLLSGERGAAAPQVIQRIKIEKDGEIKEVAPKDAATTYISQNTSEYQGLQMSVGEGRAKNFVNRVLQFVHDKGWFDEDETNWADLTDTVDHLLKGAPTDDTLETISIKEVKNLAKAKAKAEAQEKILKAVPVIKASDVRGKPQASPTIKKDDSGFRVYSPGMEIKGKVHIEQLGSTGQLYVGWVQNVISAERICTLDSAGVKWSERVENQANDVHQEGSLWYGIQGPSPSPIKSLSTYPTWMIDTPATPLNQERTRPDKPWTITGKDRFIAWLCAVPDPQKPLIYVYYVIWNTVWDASGKTADTPVIGENLKVTVEAQGEGQGPYSVVTSPTSFKAVKRSGEY